ncbi:hypothetical protein WMY93_010638 [Mugilogobius chulae]|uniref:Receptor ligand binding region domain-containing protein n=1 Tax=Mugilogobius chulae TaxID=88201 RepID=A0AAW0PGX6_9GOBI
MSLTTGDKELEDPRGPNPGKTSPSSKCNQSTCVVISGVNDAQAGPASALHALIQQQNRSSENTTLFTFTAATNNKGRRHGTCPTRSVLLGSGRPSRSRWKRHRVQPQNVSGRVHPSGVEENVSALFGPACPEEAEVTGLIASTWNIPMFGFVGQSSKLDNTYIYDSYVKIVPPLKRSAEVLVKTLEYFNWRYVAMIGGGLDSNTWDKVDALWKTVEDPLRQKFKLTAAVKFDTSNPQLIYNNIKFIATVARGQYGL